MPELGLGKMVGSGEVQVASASSLLESKIRPALLLIMAMTPRLPVLRRAG
jgi:hypothetical protein